MTRWLIPLLAALHALAFWGAGPVDDDYICYRYAQSLVEGRGFAWFGDVQTEGFTVPLWVGLHAIGLVLGLDPTVSSRLVGALAAGLACWAVGDAAARSRGSHSFLGPAILVAVAPALAFHGAAGLGTTLQASLLALHARQVVRRAQEGGEGTLLDGLPLALACLVRQEAFLFVVPHLAALPKSRRLLALPMASLIGWTSFRLAWFGEWFPLSLGVKRLPLTEDLSYGARYLLEDLPLLGTLPIALLLLLRWRCLSVERPLGVGFLLHLLYVAAVGGDHMAWSRLLVPAAPIGFLLAWRVLPDRVPRSALVGLVAVGLQAPHLLGPQDVRSSQARFLDRAGFEDRWEVIGTWMGEHAPPGTRVLVSPIGAIGWTSGLEVLDLLGLVHPHARELAPDLSVGVKGHHRSATDWALAQEPEWILIGNGVRIQGALEACPWEVELVQDPRFAQGYRHARVPMPSGEDLDLFVRRTGPLPLGGRWESP